MLLFVGVPSAAGLGLSGCPLSLSHRIAARAIAMVAKEPDDPLACGVDEPPVECAIRRQVDGPWADVWARYVLLRPGMSFGELKAKTFERNQLDPMERIPGTYRTVVITHVICFLAAIPAVLTSDAVFPKLVGAAAVSRVASGL